VEHWKNTPDTAVRFLRARPGDVAAALTMFCNMIQWRQDHQVDIIREDYDPSQIFIEKFSGAIWQGLDKDGDPIFVGRMRLAFCKN
jgi:hypothetical protein